MSKKYLVINLTKEVKDLAIEKYNSLLRKRKPRKWKHPLFIDYEDQYYQNAADPSKLFIDSTNHYKILMAFLKNENKYLLKYFICYRAIIYKEYP